MDTKDALKTQYGFFYQTAKANLDGLTAEDSLVQPAGGGNCTNWILGHLVSVHNGVMGLVDEEPVWESEQLERASDGPITSADEAIDWDTMVERLLGSEERFMSALDALTDEQLDEGGLTGPFGNELTRAEFLNFMAFHQAYHVGQLGLSRRIAGHPGAIRGPQERTAEA